MTATAARGERRFERRSASEGGQDGRTGRKREPGRRHGGPRGQRSRSESLSSCCGVSTCVTAADASAQADPFAACRQRLAERPDDYESAYVSTRPPSSGDLWSRGLTGVRDADARACRQLLAAARVRPSPSEPESRRRSRRRRGALPPRGRGFQSQRHAEGEILARSNLRDILFPTRARRGGDNGGVTRHGDRRLGQSIPC